MWITNGGFADVFTVFAKIDGKAFTAFIVERAWKGVTVGAEEKKLGIKGSSTCQVFFENVAVPVENVLGEIGKGHKIAFNILNIGRVKLAAGVVGASKHITGIAAKYANERQQFGQPIAHFGAIQHKIGEMATRTYAIESAVYRVSNDIQTWESAGLAEGKTMNEALLAAAEEYAIECALLKVAGSECLDFAADEGLQIYGGMGYSEEAPMASIYRDARINRIFEGTNEINRMLAVDMLLKRTLRGDIDLFTHVMALQAELLAPPSFGSSASSNPDGFDAERQTVVNLKKLCLITAGATAQHFTTALETEQEILMNIADMMTAAYIAESVLLRTLRRFAEQKADAATLAIAADMTRLYVYDALERSAGYGKAVIAAWATGDEKRMLMLALRRFAKQEDINTKTMRRNVAAYYLANAPK